VDKDMNTCSDEELMSFLVGEGDLKAFEELITRYEQQVFTEMVSGRLFRT
jgi:hypothetical protein